MLFELSREEMVASLGGEAVFVAPSGSLGRAADDTPGVRVLLSVGIPTGVFRPEELTGAGRFPSVGDRLGLPARQAGPPGCGEWPVFGRLPLTYLALDPRTGRVHGFSENGGPAQELHTDLSSLAYLTFGLQRLLDGFDWSDDEGAEAEENDFDRLAESVDAVRASVAARDPLPFSGVGVWSAVLDDVAAGMWS